eukprot:GFUD01018199.1.p1 GENE.GFUD01018199.1~~GFUD01018199.1.p1  ORF type:complete len:117 (-),score=3.19 GFUD01018199.1:717-1067(-)
MEAKVGREVRSKSGRLLLGFTGGSQLRIWTFGMVFATNFQENVNLEVGLLFSDGLFIIGLLYRPHLDGILLYFRYCTLAAELPKLELDSQEKGADGGNVSIFKEDNIMFTQVVNVM